MYEAEKAQAISALATRFANGDMSAEDYDKSFNTIVRNFERLAALSKVENDATNANNHLR